MFSEFRSYILFIRTSYPRFIFGNYKTYLLNNDDELEICRLLVYFIIMYRLEDLTFVSSKSHSPANNLCLIKFEDNELHPVSRHFVIHFSIVAFLKERSWNCIRCNPSFDYTSLVKSCYVPILDGIPFYLNILRRVCGMEWRTHSISRRKRAQTVAVSRNSACVKNLRRNES